LDRFAPMRTHIETNGSWNCREQNLNVPPRSAPDFFHVLQSAAKMTEQALN